MTWNICRLCGKDKGQAPLFKYSVRHYAHAHCGFSRWGVGFLDMIPAHQVGELPFLAAVEAGLGDEVERRWRAHMKGVQS